MNEIDQLLRTRCKAYYLHEVLYLKDKPWQLGWVPADPLYWYAVNVETTELRRIAPVATMDYTTAALFVQALSTDEVDRDQ